MNLAAVIFAVATVASSIPMEEHNCGGLCTAEYAPITCSDGAVYSNACELAKAQCNPHAFDNVTCGGGVRE
ncbi:hypothetical protein MY11210_006905 [Beauveria gryllotalpidicola]